LPFSSDFLSALSLGSLQGTLFWNGLLSGLRSSCFSFVAAAFEEILYTPGIFYLEENSELLENCLFRESKVSLNSKVSYFTLIKHYYQSG